MVLYVYTMGRVGTTSLREFLDTAGPKGGFPVNWSHHTHKGLEYYTSGAKAEVAKRISEKVDLRMITLFRDPFYRNLSAFSHSLGIQDEKKRFFGDYEWHNTPFDWFPKEVYPRLGIDVLSQGFNKDAGYSIYKNGNIRLLVMLTERMNDVIYTATSEFLERDMSKGKLPTDLGSFIKIRENRFHQIRRETFPKISIVDYVDNYVRHPVTKKLWNADMMNERMETFINDKKRYG